jgi:hypothetical protein
MCLSRREEENPMKIRVLAFLLFVAVTGVLISCMPTLNAMLNPPTFGCTGSGNDDKLVPNPGVITITISTESKLTKIIVVRNLTGKTLTEFNAYMQDNQLYGPSGLDWIIVDFEAPWSIENNETVSITLNICPQDVPEGTYERELIIKGLADGGLATTNVRLNITVYKPVELPSNVLLDLTPETICEGNEVTLRVTAEGLPIAVDIWLGSAKLGTTDNSGELKFNAPLIKGTYVVSAKIEDQVIGISNLPVYKKIVPQIVAPENVNQGDPIEGQVLDNNGNPLSGIVVVCDGRSSTTDEAGYFSLSTGDLKERAYSVRTLQKIDENAMIMYPQSSVLVSVIGKSFAEFVIPYIFALAIVIVIAIVILLLAKWSRSPPAPPRSTR